MNIANKLTLSRVLLVFVFMFVMWSSIWEIETTLWIALILFIVASVTDFFDGYVARKYNLITNLGKFMDPLADKILVTAAMIAIVDKGPLPAGILPAWVVVLILIREFAISGIRLLAANQNSVIAASPLAKFKTAAQMIMIILFLVPIQAVVIQVGATIFMYASLVLTVISGLQYAVVNKQVFKETK
jgi:CDP-diacylglycerol--glycerol-3-phosphate 3-phosphatidyltransferase